LEVPGDGLLDLLADDMLLDDTSLLDMKGYPTSGAAGGMHSDGAAAAAGGP
jgi:hypothetical protein